MGAELFGKLSRMYFQENGGVECLGARPAETFGLFLVDLDKVVP